MKLKMQILTIGISGVVIAACVGLAGLLGTEQLASAFRLSADMAQASQSSQVAANAIGAIRSDVQRALLGAMGRDKAQIDSAATALAGHVDKLQAALTVLQDSGLGNASKAYTDAAARVMAMTRGDSAAAAAVPEFQKLYGALETQISLQDAAIEKEKTRIAAQSNAMVRRSRWTVVIALFIATLALVGGALWVAQKMAAPMANAVAVSQRLAQGDLTGKIEPVGNDETVVLLRAMAEMQDNFERIARSVKFNADAVASASSEIAHGNDDLSARTERQASALQETTTLMENLRGAVQRNAQNAQQGNQLAHAASAVAADGGQIVGQVVETMKGIHTSSKKIADIISVIDGIAFQTNILALNAAVEAARAGEQGRGFAVVASEVRSLAGRSADAAKEINALISDSVQKVAYGSDLVDRAGRTMNDVVHSVAHVTTIMTEISEASALQSAGVNQVGEAVHHMDVATQQNAALVEQMAASANHLKSQAQDMVLAVSAFTLKDAAPLQLAV